MRESASILDRIKKYISKSERNCWLWQGDTDNRDTPRIYTGDDAKGNPVNRAAARVVWEQKFATPLKDTEYLRRTCRYKKCVNPNHHRLALSPNAKLTEDQMQEVADLFNIKKQGAPLLAKAYGISRQQVYAILKKFRGVGRVTSKSK